MVTTWSDAGESQRNGSAAPGARGLAGVGCEHRRPPGRVAGELALAVLVAAAVSMVLQWLIARPHLPFPTNATTALATLGTTAVLLALGGLVLWRWRRPERWPWWAMLGSWSGLSALVTMALALPLAGTKFYYGGISIDQLFRTQYLTRLTSSPALSDMNYADLPPYYPAGWFWVGGRFANLIGKPGWEAFKPYAITTAAVVAAVGFVLWSAVLRRHLAMLVALTTAVAVALTDGSATEPYSWMVAGLLPPVVVLAHHALRAGLDPGEPAHRHRWALVGVGGYVGVAGAIYTLYFGFAVFVLVLTGASVVGAAWWAGRRGQQAVAWPVALRVVLLRLVGVGLAALPIMLLVWTPYLVASVRAGMPSGVAPRYLPADSAVFPLPMLQVSLFGALCLVGTGWMLLFARRDERARALLIATAGGYLWFVLSTLDLLRKTTLLAFRIQVPLNAVFAAAGVLGVVELARQAVRLLRQEHRRRAITVAVAIGFLAAIGIAQATPERMEAATYSAYHDYYPTGVTALRASSPDDDGSYNGQLIDAINRLTGRPPQDVVVLSTYPDILSFEPYRGFQQSTPHYANPLANFDARRAEVASWARARDAADLRHRLAANAHRAPDVFVLRRESDGLHARLSQDIFPAQPNVGGYDVVFPERLFASPGFTERNVGPFVVIVRH
jgi:galactan 5-O-arabinofuranosyltransferase